MSPSSGSPPGRSPSTSASPPEGIVGDGHTALATDDVEAARAHLSGMGYATEDASIPMGYPRFTVRDPWGNQFEILPAKAALTPKKPPPHMCGAACR